MLSTDMHDAAILDSVTSSPYWGFSFHILQVKHDKRYVTCCGHDGINIPMMADMYRPSRLMMVIPRRIMEKAVTTCQTCQVCLCTSLPNQPPRIHL